MNGTETIDLYSAIKEMRRLTAEGKTFSFTHATYNRPSRSTDGIKHIAEARLREAASKDDIKDADYKLFYFDVKQQLNRNCWQMLILFFNGKKVILT